ncbi:MAG: substrate-binding domain-containing protein [Chloroflexia bacterium]
MRILTALIAVLLVGASARADGPLGPLGVPARPLVTLAGAGDVVEGGLLGELVPGFEEATGYRIEVLALGNGQALEMGRQGKVDAMLAYPPGAGAGAGQVGAEGAGVDLGPVIDGYYMIVGPASDPARLAGRRAVEALWAIASSGTTWVSRRDGSETNLFELDLWQETLGRDAQHEGWYVSTHQGMSATLAEAEKRQAYTLTSRAAFEARGGSRLKPLVENDPRLRLPYHLILADERKWPEANGEGARTFADYLRSAEARRIVENYGVDRFGQPLYAPH